MNRGGKHVRIGCLRRLAMQFVYAAALSVFKVENGNMVAEPKSGMGGDLYYPPMPVGNSQFLLFHLGRSLFSVAVVGLTNVSHTHI